MEYHIRQNNLIKLKHIIFPYIEENKINDLLIDNDSIKYITFASSAQEITNIIMNNLDFKEEISLIEKMNNLDFKEETSLIKKMNNLVITDMTAGVGGNVLNFSNYFKYVNAIEIELIRYNYLINNIKTYGYNNINCYNNNSIKLLLDEDDIRQDIIFFDPPWGGINYKEIDNIRLTFENRTIEEICNLLIKNETKMIVIKLPNNYDFNFFIKEIKYPTYKYIINKMTIMIIKYI